MVLVQYLEDKNIVLSQLLRNIPAAGENIKIKGKKAKIVSVKEIEENHIQVQVVFEKEIKNQPIAKDTKKKKK